MKHLKSYKIFEANFHFKDELEDILLELTDNGLYYDMEETNHSPSFAGYSKSMKALAISIWAGDISTPPYHESFKWDDIKDVVERIEEYCFKKDSGYSIDVEVTRRNQILSLDNFIETYGNEEFSYPGISLLIYSDDDYEELLMMNEHNITMGKDEKYEILDFLNDIRKNRWEPRISDSELKRWTDHFIGDGWYDKINIHIDKMFNAMKKVDCDYINDRLLEVWDEIPNKDTWVTTGVAYGNYYEERLNGMLTVNDPNKNDRKKWILLEILHAILWPTIRLGYYSNELWIRSTPEENYVEDEKFQCQNFDLTNFSYFVGQKDDGTVSWMKEGEESDKIVDISKYEIKRYEKYSPQSVLEKYVPCVIIDIGRRDGHMSGTMNLRKLEQQFDEALPSILSALNYDEVVWDASRGTRQFDDNMDIYDYTLKIMLKF